MERCYVTNNKINIFQYPGEHVHGFSLSMYIKAGSMYESPDTNGISHFLEHLIIRNINHLMDGQLYKYLDRWGLMFNACTYKEFVQFEITGAAKNFNKAVDVFVKVFDEFTLPSAEIEIERNRIKAEIREDDDKDKLAYFSNQITWKGTSLAQTITGNSSKLNRMNRKILRETHNMLMVSDNLFVYVTGSAGEEEIDYLKCSLEKYDIKEGFLNRNNIAKMPEGFGKRDAEVATKKSKDTVVRFSFDLDYGRFPQAVYMLLYDIIFECETSKLHQALSEEAGLIYSFDSVMEEYSNLGMLCFQYEVQPANLLQSVRIVIDLLKTIKNGIEDELDYVKPTYIDNAELILDDPSAFNWMQAYEGHILAKSSAELEERKAEYESVTSEQIVELADHIFRSDNLVVTMKGQKSIKLEKQIREMILELNPEE